MPRRLLGRYGGLALCLASFAACGFPRPADVPECARSADCTSPGAPVCETSSGTCVGCLDAASCPTDKPVCDASSHACRVCDRDDECPSGVCLDAEGRCAMASEVVFVRELSTDNAMCSATMPCATFAAALAMLTPQRYIIHIIGGTFHMNAGVELSGKRVYVDGSDTNIICNQGIPFSSTKNGPSITLGRMTINGVGGGTGVLASNNGAIQLYGAALPGGAVAMGGSLDIQNSTAVLARCSDGGTLSVKRSDVSSVASTNCTLTVSSDRFVSVGRMLDVTGGAVIVENNTFVSNNEFTDPVSLTGAVSGSRFAFNTMVNASGLDGTATALFCDPSLDVSSNIFAWHSSGTGLFVDCVAHDSIFDEIALPAFFANNRQASASTFFVDLVGGDFHLSANSPAKAGGQPGVVDVDLDGNPRPVPAGSPPDIGAYESP